MKKASCPVPVDPGAVRVWRGFKLPSLDMDTYCKKIGEILIPATIQIQTQLGLTAYLPTILPADIPTTVPDEIALVSYESPEVYEHTFKTTGGRGYGLMHSAIFDFSDRVSQTGFAILAAQSIQFDQAYYLFANEADWLIGEAKVLTGIRPASQNKDDFLTTISGLMKNIQSQPPAGMDGAFFVITADYLIYWEHWQDEQSMKGSRISELAQAAPPLLLKQATKVFVPPGLDDDYDGLKVSGGDCLNILFERR